MAQVFHDIACTGCGCVCDDLVIEVDGGRVVRAEGACHLVEAWYAGLDAQTAPAALVRGQVATLDQAIDAAAELLARSRSPLVYGLSRSSTPGQRAAVRLADQLGATIDTTASRCHGPSILAVQSVGESTCTLGETKTRSDLVVYWGSNPLVSHPRHLERYSVDSAGDHMASARGRRQLVVVDVERTETAARADLFVRVDAGGDFDAIWALRALLSGRTIAESSYGGAPFETLRDLAERMRACQSGVVFFGLGLTKHDCGHLTVEALLRLVRDLNDHTRFYARRMRVMGDVTGADTVLCWQTGFPFSVNLARGYPRYNPGEYSASEVLERAEVDCCVLLGSESAATLSPAAQARLREIPTIAIDYPGVPAAIAPTVRITTAIYGVHLPGTAYRMDETPIPLRGFLPPRHPSDEAALERLRDAVARRGDAR